MPAPNAFSHNHTPSVFSPANKVVVFHGKHHNFLAKTDLFFFDFAPLFVKIYGEWWGETLLP